MESSNLVIEKHITVDENSITLIDLLFKNCRQISRQKLKLAMKYGAVWLTPQAKNNQPRKTTRIRRAKKLLQTGYQVHLYYNEAILFSEIKPAKLVSDEGEYSIWNKPGGMFSQGSKWGDHTSVCRWIELFGLAENNLPVRQCFLVHRLDRATNGLILVAHSKQATNLLTQLFETRKIHKHYSAVVKGKCCLETVPLVIDSDIEGKCATSIILSADYDSDVDQTSLIVEIKTGRKHQIRRHLSMNGFPVVGDRLYSGDQENLELMPDLMLTACFIEFVCPFRQITKTYLLETD